MKFEELIANPDTETKAACGFLGLDDAQVDQRVFLLRVADHNSIEEVDKPCAREPKDLDSLYDEIWQANSVLSALERLGYS
jgi:hypothetical protein